MSQADIRTDDELLRLNVPALITDGLADPAVRGPHAARWLFAEGAVAAAVRAGHLGVLPRSLTFLAEIVRRGGVPYGVALPEPLPLPGQAELAQEWLTAAERAAPAETAPADQAHTRDQVFARWLDAVAAIVDARSAVSGRPADVATGR